MRSFIDDKLNNRPAPNRDFSKANRLGAGQGKNADMVRAKSSIDVGVVNPTDPDMRKMLTPPMQGIVPTIQGTGVGVTGRIAINNNVGQTNPSSGQPLLQVSGQPVLLYPVSSGDTGVNTVYTRGGQYTQRRYYPVRELTHLTDHSYTFGDAGPESGLTTYDRYSVVIVRDGTGSFLNLDALTPGIWDENSPLPPGVRYYELSSVDPPAQLQAGESVALRLSIAGYSTADDFLTGWIQTTKFNGDPNYHDYDALLPHDSKGRIRRNFLPFPAEAIFHIQDFRSDDTKMDKYWTGECDDPLNWEDAWWQGLDYDPSGNTPRVNKEGLATYLQSHPNAQLR